MTKLNGQVASYAPSMGAAIFAAILATATGGMSPTQAASNCGIDGAGLGTLTCTTASPGAPFAAGINYTNSDGLILILDDGALTIGNPGVLVYGSGPGNVSVIGTNVGTITTTGSFSYGLTARITNTASTASATAILTTGNIITTGSSGRGVKARNNGLGFAFAQMDGGTITTAGFKGFGVTTRIGNAASTATATSIMTAGVITTAGTDGVGVLVQNQGLGDSLVRMDGGTVNTTNGAGLLARNFNAASTGLTAAILTGGNINTAFGTFFAYGVQAQTSGLGDVIAQMDGGTVTTGGANIAGLVTRITNATSTATSTAVLTGGDISTTGDGSAGMRVDAAGVGDVIVSTVGTGTITTTGDNANGIEVIQNNAAATGTTTITIGADITAGGDGINVNTLSSGAVLITGNGNITGGTDIGDDGIEVAAQSSVTIDVNGTITGDPGILVNSAFGPIVVLGAGGVTGFLGNGIETNITDGTATNGVIISHNGIITGGDNGVLATNAGAGNIGIGVVQSITGGTGYGINTQTTLGASTSITVTPGAVVSSTAGLGIFNNEGDSFIGVNPGGSIVGDIVLSDGSDILTFSGNDFSGVTLFDGGDDTGTADGFFDQLFFTNATATLDGTIVQNWEEIFITSSTIGFGATTLTAGLLTINANSVLDATGGAFTLTGNMDNLGTINMADGTVDDSVTVSGNYTGGGELQIDVDFAIDVADTLVIGGNVSGGTTTIAVSDVSSGAATGNDVLVVDVSGTSPADAFSLAAPVISGALSYDLSQIGDDWFLSQTGLNPAAPVYEVYSQVLSGLNVLPTLYQRFSNRRWAGGTPAGQAGTNSLSEYDTAAGYGDRGDFAGTQPVIWARIVGSGSEVQSNVSTTAARFDTRRWQLQAGIDGELASSSDGRWVFGINGFIGRSNSNVFSATGNGSISVESYGLGLTATWYGDEGLYIDGQARFSLFSSDLGEDASGVLVNDNDGSGTAFSLEVGRRMEMGNGRVITPQAQIVTSSVEFDNFTGPNGAAVSLSDGDNITGRLGIAFERQLDDTSLYALANIYSQFSGDSQVNVSGTALTNSPDQFSGEIGLGGSFSSDSGKTTLFGEATIATSLENFGQSNQFKGIAGVRVTF